MGATRTLFWLKVKLKLKGTRKILKGQLPIKMVLVGAQRGDFSSVGHGGLDREFQRETHELERNLKIRQEYEVVDG